MYIAIDGPAGAGKSTIAKLLAQRQKINYLDTGAMYRAITLRIIREGVSLSREEVLQELLDGTSIEMVDPLKENRVLLDGTDVTEEIRGGEVNRWVSQVSSLALVREDMVKKQRELARKWGGVVMDGRDIGTCVLPDATFKFYLDASAEERIRRRWQEMKDKGREISWEEARDSVLKRDEIDQNRSVSPLEVAPGAVVLDTTRLSIEEVIREVAGYMMGKEQENRG